MDEKIIAMETLRAFFLERRRAILAELDAIERLLDIMPTTAQIRKTYKERGKNHDIMRDEPQPPL